MSDEFGEGSKRSRKTHVVEQLVEILILERIESRFLTVESSESEFSFGERPIHDSILIDRRTRRLWSEGWDEEIRSVQRASKDREATKLETNRAIQLPKRSQPDPKRRC